MRTKKMRQSGQNLAEYKRAGSPLHCASFGDHKSNFSSLPDIEHPSIRHTKSHHSLPSVPSTSSLSSSISNYSNPSPLLKYEHKLQKNQSLSSLRCKYGDGHFLAATTFSAPISPKYNNQRFHPLQQLEPTESHILPPIHKIKQIKPRIPANSQHESLFDDSMCINQYPSNCDQRHHSQKHRQNAKKRVKRNASTSALSLDLSVLSIDENSNKLQCINTANCKSAHICHLNLNTNNIKSNILLHFDIAPKSVDSASSYEITPNGAFKQNGFTISSDGLQIESVSNCNRQSNAYHVQSSDFVEVSILGRGSSSVVYKTWDLRNGRFIALKCISAFEHDKRKQILNELKLLTNNSCAEIIEFYGSYFYSGQIMLCLEYFDIGSLQELIEINGRIPVHIISFIIKYVIKAIHYLHTAKQKTIQIICVMLANNHALRMSTCHFFFSYKLGERTNRNRMYVNVVDNPQYSQRMVTAMACDRWSSELGRNTLTVCRLLMRISNNKAATKAILAYNMFLCLSSDTHSCCRDNINKHKRILPTTSNKGRFKGVMIIMLEKLKKKIVKLNFSVFLFLSSKVSAFGFS